MKPPLLLLLLVAGFVSCIPRERQETWDANDGLEPLSALGDRGGPSLSLSNVNPLTEDADQQLNSDGDADNNYQERNYLKEPNPTQTQEERKIKPSDVLSRSLRIFRYKQNPSRYKPARRRGYQPRYRVRGKPRQKSKEFGVGDYNNYQQDEEEDEEEDNEMDEEENYDDDDVEEEEEEEDGDDVVDYDEEEEEEEEDYQPVRRPPPKRLRGKLRRGKTRRRGRYRRDLEGHEDTKRGFKLQKKLKPRKKNKVKEINKTDTGEDYSDSDDDDETRPLLRGQRKNWKKASTSSRKDSHYASSRDITKRGLFSKIKNIFKKKKPTPSRRYQRLRNDDSDEHDDGGYDNYGYEDDDINSNRIDEDEDMYGDYSDERLLPGKRKSKFLGFSRHNRIKRGDLIFLDRVLRNFALLSSHLKENKTQSITTPPLDSLNEGLREDQGKEDEGGEYKDEDEDKVKDEDYDEEEEEENEAQNEKNRRLDDKYDSQDNQNSLGDEYEVKGEENGNQIGEYETENAGYEAQGQGIQSQNDEYKSQDDEDKGQSNEVDKSDEDYDDSDEDYDDSDEDYDESDEDYDDSDEDYDESDEDYDESDEDDYYDDQ